MTRLSGSAPQNVPFALARGTFGFKRKDGQSVGDLVAVVVWYSPPEASPTPEVSRLHSAWVRTAS
jgi:hypothetical protein